MSVNKNKIRLKAFNFLGSFGEKIKTKFTNVCAKTGQYNVPNELFQKRTSRSNRVLIAWKSVKENNLNIKELRSFSGGVVVEFINNDFFDESNNEIPIFNVLKNLIGSNEIVSSIISIRSESGSSSSAIQRDAFAKLVNNTKINYKGDTVCINIDNYKEYAIRQTQRGGTGNDKWSGFLFVSIRGGQQDTIETHKGEELTIFNPACEFATQDVCLDLDITVAYFAMLSVDVSTLNEEQKSDYKDIFDELEKALFSCSYDSEDYKGNLLDYVKSHPSVRMKEGELTDPIQVKRIDILNFSDDKRNSDSIDFTHNEAVIFEKFYWDKSKKCILSPARPTNVFWSFHLSNMMQQNYDLNSYFKYEEERYKQRQYLLKRDS